ncbi:AAA family ATPase [Scytonema sp. UIC 10036]|uniref:ATP-binding protein n=1 Tax=Scytonema sp. UIC 10036 TaxID=2304196 RepID=UPI0012DA7072|nr:ATP-binding protein [Scytonema sp. UIC 10036]MUG98754.1 AAA family ATPase [Scytonema sp. UIC 10036]
MVETIQPDIFISGIPNTKFESINATYRSRLIKATEDFLEAVKLNEIKVTIYNRVSQKNEDVQSEINIDKKIIESFEDKTQQYKSQQPLFSFDQLVVPSEVKEDLLSAISIIDVEKTVFDEWGLRKIEPFPRTSLNFYGPPGTGKTLAAHAIASYIKCPILIASYAEIESKYHGEGPKNVKAIFKAAERDNALLFIDEADSLLSRRLLNVTQGSEQAINSMRSQLLINLEQFRGIVIFSTNLVENYDKAFETRIKHIFFSLPDEACRREIWKNHLPKELPLSKDISVEELASLIDDVCGRDIKNAIIDASVKVAIQNKSSNNSLVITKQNLIDSINRIKKSRIIGSRKSSSLSAKEVEEVNEKVHKKLAIESI